jgi:hypothetical protein
MTKKTAVQKRDVQKSHKIVSPIPAGFPAGKDADSMVVSTPLEINGILRRVPEGELTTLDEVRGYLAGRYATDIACPVSTAIFINIAAAAAEEERAQGVANITPYWRTLRPGGKLNPKYPGGVEKQKALLEAEGFTVRLSKGGYAVEDYVQFLADLTLTEEQ